MNCSAGTDQPQLWFYLPSSPACASSSSVVPVVNYLLLVALNKNSNNPLTHDTNYILTYYLFVTYSLDTLAESTQWRKGSLFSSPCEWVMVFQILITVTYRTRVLTQAQGQDWRQSSHGKCAALFPGITTLIANNVTNDFFRTKIRISMPKAYIQLRRLCSSRMPTTLTPLPQLALFRQMMLFSGTHIRQV